MRNPKRLHMKKDQHGAIGIGTLIVFIAMVLVAVIAAAVIIKTASELEQSAEEYGDKAGKEVGLGIKVQQFEGQANAAGDEIILLHIYISLFGGSQSVNLEDLILHISGTDNDPTGAAGFTEDYLHNPISENPSSLPLYDVIEITDPLDSYDAGNNMYILDQESTLMIELDSSTLGAGGLSPLSNIVLKFMMGYGGAITTESASTPGAYQDDGWYNLV